jgi:hypothetical protein
MDDQKDYYGDVKIRQDLVDVDRDPVLVETLQELLGTAGHVFKCHGAAVWSVPGSQKDYYAGCLAEVISQYPNLPHRLLKSGNRLIKMLTHRALDMQKEAEAKGTSVRELYHLDERFKANPPGRDRRWK